VSKRILAAADLANGSGGIGVSRTLLALNGQPAASATVSLVS
jgi:hypothetical protein